MKQITLAASGFEKYGKVAKRSVFPAEMAAWFRGLRCAR
jgi:hypothetical protein